ncbi:MAG: hypothetical protein EOP84_02885 [Verrucomicrobiaceae bacterium]|nr:MAG: hypothetical protein EOP84_02885 [Verrucomicrobiaceae bacterium]
MLKPDPAEVEGETVYTCEHCKRAYRTEGGFLNHMCAQKQRYMDRDLKHVKLGFFVYQRFYDISYKSTKPRTYDNFSKSQFYAAFVRFARYLLDINAVNPTGFVDFLLKMGLPIDKWQSPVVYDTYLRELVKRESSDAALERNFLLMEHWASESGEVWTDFFRKVQPARAVLWIRSGRISPWVIYTADSADELFTRFTPEQMGLVQEALDPVFWTQKLAENETEVQAIRAVLKDSGL